MTFGERLKELRLSKGWSQSALAVKLGTTDMTISRYENDVNEPSLTTLKILSNLFNVSIEFLLGEEADTSDVKAMTVFKMMLKASPDQRDTLYDVAKAILKEDEDN